VLEREGEEVVSVSVTNTGDTGTEGFLPPGWKGVVAYHLRPTTAEVGKRYRIDPEGGGLAKEGQTCSITVSRKADQPTKASDGFILFTERTAKTKPLQADEWLKPEQTAFIVEVKSDPDLAAKKKKKAEADAKKQAAAEKKRKAQEIAEAKQKAEAEARARAEEASKQAAAEEEAKRRAEEEAKAEEHRLAEERKEAEEAERRKAAEEAKRKAEDEAAAKSMLGFKNLSLRCEPCCSDRGSRQDVSDADAGVKYVP